MRAVQGEACRIFAVGFSAGSNCLTKYVGEKGAGCQLAAAVSVANAFDIKRGLAYVRKHARLLDRCASFCVRGLAHVRNLVRFVDRGFYPHGRANVLACMRKHAPPLDWWLAMPSLRIS